LIEAVEKLTTFASSPEFASVPAKISTEARKAQEPVTSSGKALIDGACHMVQAAKQLAVNPKDPPTYQLYSNHSKSVSDAIKRLVSSMKECAPGQKECEVAIQRANAAIRDLDQASLAAISQSLPPRETNTLQGFQEQMNNSARELAEIIEPVRVAGCEQTEKLGHLVSTMLDYLEPLSSSAIGTASKTLYSKRQMAILDQTKTVAESALQLIYAVKEGGGNKNAINTHTGINEAADTMRDSMQELNQTLEEAASATGNVSTMIDSLNKSLAKTEERIAPTDNIAFVDYQTDMVRLAKQIARIAQDMVGKSGSNVGELGGLANMITRDYSQLAKQSTGAVATTANTEIANRIKAAVQELGSGCIELVRDAGNLQSNPTDSFSKRDLADHARKVSEKVSKVLAALQAGARGTQACIHAASTVSGIIGDLDTTIMFATAGTLNAEGEESFADHRENILKTAKSLVEDTKTLVAGAASNQEQLAVAAQSAVMTITRLADCVKFGAASLGSEQPEAQVLLINAVKDVAHALGELISATKNASGKAAVDPSMSTLKDTAKVMVTNVTSLLKTVKTVEDEAARGTRALESTIEAIGQELRNYSATDRVEKVLTPEDLIRYTKPLTIATGKAVAAGNSCRQEDVIAAANMSRKAIFELLHVCKGAAAGGETAEARQKAIESGRLCATAYKELLDHVNLVIQKPTPENKQKLAMFSKKVALAVTELVRAAESLKGSDWVDPDDLTAFAESELLGAANSIEAAAKKLAALQPRKQPQAANENLNFDQQILEAAKSIAAATAALVKSASAAQKELVLQGKIGQYSNTDPEDDNQWSQGLVSAARMVAAATHNLCDAANAMVQGHASEEKLISSAKQVAASTAQLLVACKVKADVDSVAMKRLQHAGNAVKRATDALVQAALQSKGNVNYEETITVNQKMVSGMAQLIMAKEEILIKERELGVARRKLETIRKAKYKGSDTEEDGYGSSF